MRFVVFGAGAIGGVVAMRLHGSGHDVRLIARGAHHDAIAERGLTLETPLERVSARLEVARTPAEAAIGDDDVVLLATKSQDTLAALDTLLDAAPATTPVVCLQNGVANERIALRRFADTYGACVMSPTAHMEPGIVQAYGTKLTGTIDIGRYPHGVDDRAAAICAALAASDYEAEPREQIMRFKYAKLISNLANAVQAICGAEADAGDLVRRVQEEGREVLRAAGIEFDVPEVGDIGGRWKRWGVAEIDGRPRGGGSTWQSVARRTGSVETDYLNGEVVLQARLLGIAAPVNELLQTLAWEMVRGGEEPGWMTPEQVVARL